VSTHPNGCKTTATKNLTVINSFAVGIADQIKAQIKLYPNPSEGVFRVDLPSLPAKASLRLVNVHGQAVYVQQLNHRGAQSIDIQQPQLPAGVYVLQIKWGDELVSKRVVIHAK
jgi:hypothetical protein